MEIDHQHKLPSFLLVDDHPIVLSALIGLLQGKFPGSAIFKAGNYAEAVSQAGQNSIDIAIIDLDLGKMDGVELIKFLYAGNPNLAILVLSLHTGIAHAERSLRAGARGYVPKNEAPTCILGAIQTVLNGNIYLPPQIALGVASLSAKATSRPKNQLGLEGLSDRELQIYSLIGQGLSLPLISKQLHISIKTVETYRDRLKEKLGVPTAQALREKAFQWKLAGGK